MDELTKIALGAGGSGLKAASAMNPYAALGMAVPQLFQGILGTAQMIHGDKMAKRLQRPMMGVPGAQQEAVANARNMAMGEAPGLSQARQLMAQNQAGSTAGILNSGGGSNEKLAALTQLNNNANLQALQIGSDQSAWRAGQNQNLQGQLGQLANTQQQMWETNKYQPFLDMSAAAQNQRNSGIQNISGMLEGLGGTFAAAVSKGAKPNISGLMGTTPVPNSVEQKYAGTPADSAAVDPSKDYQRLLGIGDPLQPRGEDQTTPPATDYKTLLGSGEETSSPASRLNINTSGPGEPIPFMGSVEPTDNELIISRDNKTGNFDPKVYDPRTGKVLPKNGASSFAGANPDARIFGMPPKFDASGTIDNYDFSKLTPAEMLQPNTGPFPSGFDPKTGKVTPLVGPPNYSPVSEAPKGPFPSTMSAPTGPFPSGFDPKTGKVTPLVGPPNYSPVSEAPKGPFPSTMSAPTGPFPVGYPDITKRFGGMATPNVYGGVYKNIMKLLQGY